MRKGHAGRFFSWLDLTANATARRLGLDNTPPPEAQARLTELVSRVPDPLRQALGRPVRITSGFRSPEVNRAIDGSAASQHMLGEAADIKVQGVSDADELAAGTDPLDADTDGDGSTDGDGLLDGDEVNEHGTDPLDPDSDGGGIPDGDEVDRGTGGGLLALVGLRRRRQR